NWYDDDRHPVPLDTFVSACTIYYTLFNSESFVSFTAGQQSQLDSIIKDNIAYSGQCHLSTYPVETLNLILGKGFYYAHAVAPSVADLSGNTTYTSIANVSVQEGQELVARFASNANMAHGSTATASSTNGGNSAGQAVDGQNGTRWESTQGVDPQWIAIDLGSAKTFNKVAIMWEGAYASAYQIQTSTDGTNWTTKLECTASSAQTVEKNIGETTARYVRIYGTARGTGYGYSIYELGVW
ncbi:MAG: discoidin domain-containing protein, partial [Paludibacteraceae bacterium]|nr:discoidin domain-containing protein [Paludibacteraceae bacterium]